MSQNYDAIFSGYEVLSELGYANAKIMKARVRAEYRKEGAPELVALKILPSAGQKDLTRFEQEAAILLGLDHPQVVKIVEVRLVNALFPFMALEYISGGDLRQLFAVQKPFSVEEVCRLGQQLCAAFGAIHEQGITHRDVKPENILVRKAPPFADYVLTDFGIALMDGQDRLSSTGESPKTLVYSSPEQCADELQPITPATDYYSLGVILYEALTGQLPYYDSQKQALTAGALRQVSSNYLIRAVNTGEVPPFPPSLGVPSWLRETIFGLLAKLPENRGLESLHDWVATSSALEARFEQGSLLWQGQCALSDGQENQGRGYLARIISHSQPDKIIYPLALDLLKPPQPVTPPIPEPTPPKPPKRGRVVVGVAIILLVIMGIYYLGPSLTSHRDKDATQGTNAIDTTTAVKPSNALPPANYVSRVGVVMLYVGGGRFTMGSNTSGEVDEQPEHVVELDGFYMGATEVTVGEYLVFCEATKTHWPEWLEAGSAYHVETGSDSYFKELGYTRKSLTLPVVGVSYLDALAYCEWLSGQDGGRRYSLPTEAQWEYAAGGGPSQGGSSQASYSYAGSNDAKAVGWVDANSGGKPHAVKGLAANSLGLYDMSGNVWEWCRDWYAADWYKQSGSGTRNAENDGYGPKGYCVLRGGSWSSNPFNARVANRDNYGPRRRRDDVGFRVVASLSN